MNWPQPLTLHQRPQLKSNANDDPKSPLWSKLFHLYHFKQDEFLPHYHQRSDSESTFPAMKRLFGEILRSTGSRDRFGRCLTLSFPSRGVKPLRRVMARKGTAWQVMAGSKPLPSPPKRVGLLSNTAKNDESRSEAALSH